MGRGIEQVRVQSDDLRGLEGGIYTFGERLTKMKFMKGRVWGGALLVLRDTYLEADGGTSGVTLSCRGGINSLISKRKWLVCRL